jgi:virginiamycin B lyase
MKTYWMLLCALVCLVPAFGQQKPKALPRGNGKATIENACSGCHTLDLLSQPGRTPADWKLLMDRMLAAGAMVPKNEVATVTAYLTANFPEVGVPKAVIVPGPIKVTFREWTAPTRGSRPHDPLAAHDGYIWYTGQYVNALGRVNTKTSEIKEFHPPMAGSGPHGLTEDSAGNIWFTGNARGYIGKLDPKTSKFTEYKLPADAADPHTPIFDQKGILWFTVQRANKIGRLDPKTGDIKIVEVPSPKSLPYGMVVDTKGTPYYCAFGVPKIGAIDPVTMKVKEWTLPNAAARPRRIAITDNDIIYYADYARGFLGRLDPKTGRVKEYPSPSGPKSQPYGITFTKGAIWYNEGATKPNTMVRFDPKTEKFQSWAIPAGGGVVRNVSVTPNGDIALAESAMNMIGLMEIGK